MSWIKTPKEMSFNDGPFHAGITKDSFYNNLNHAFDHSGYYISVGIFDADKIEHTFASSGDWDNVTEFPPIMLPIRREKDADQYNQIKIYAYGKSGSDTVDLRFYLRDTWHTGIVIDTSNPLPDENAYDDETISTGYALKTWTIRPETVADVPPMQGVFVSDSSDATDGDLEPYDIAFLFLIGKASNNGVAMELTNITIEEVIA